MMAVMMAVFGFFAPAVVVLAALIRRRSARPSLVTRSLGLALAPSLGLGAASCTYFALLVATSSHEWAVRLDVVFWALALVFIAWDARTHLRWPASLLPRHVMLSSWRSGVIVAGV